MNNNKPEDVPFVAVKFDQDKPRFDLIAPEAQLELAKVLTFGAKKYADDNWRKGFSWKRIGRAIVSHFNAFLLGKDIDQESGLLHTAHLHANTMFLLAHQVSGLGQDDRLFASSEAGRVANACYDLREEFDTCDLETFTAKLIARLAGK